jgi:hypothetical protein
MQQTKPASLVISESTDPVHRHDKPPWPLEVAMIAWLYLVYDLSRGVRHGNRNAAIRNGGHILHWEQDVHLDPEHTLNNILWHTFLSGCWPATSTPR